MASIRITATLTPAWLRANAKAVANAKRGLRAERIAEKTYRVKSATSEESYIVTVESIVNLRAHCTCSAGQHGLTCWHQSASIAAAVQRCAAKAVPAPVSAPAPRVTPEEFERRFSRV